MKCIIHDICPSGNWLHDRGGTRLHARAGESPDSFAANKKARNDAWTRWKALLRSYSPVKSAGGIPMFLFQQPAGTPVIGLPIANHDDNQHAANDNLRLQNLWDGIEVYAPKWPR